MWKLKSLCFSRHPVSTESDAKLSYILDYRTDRNHREYELLLGTFQSMSNSRILGSSVGSGLKELCYIRINNNSVSIWF